MKLCARVIIAEGHWRIERTRPLLPMERNILILFFCHNRTIKPYLKQIMEYPANPCMSSKLYPAHNHGFKFQQSLKRLGLIPWQWVTTCGLFQQAVATPPYAEVVSHPLWSIYPVTHPPLCNETLTMVCHLTNTVISPVEALSVLWYVAQCVCEWLW